MAEIIDPAPAQEIPLEHQKLQFLKQREFEGKPFYPIDDLDPKSFSAENYAYDLGQLLNSDPVGFDDEVPHLKQTFRQVAEKNYRAYYDNRKAKGLPLFPNKSGLNKFQENTRKAYAGMDQLKDNLSEDQFKILEESSKGLPDAEGYKARTINAEFLQGVYRQQIPPESLNDFRNNYAAEQLGAQGPVNDLEFYGLVQNKFQREDEATKMIGMTLEKRQDAMLTSIGKLSFNKEFTKNEKGQLIPEADGNHIKRRQPLYKQPTRQEREKWVKSLPEEFQAQARASWDAQITDLDRIFRKHEPTVKAMTDLVEIVKQGDAEKGIWWQIDKLTNQLPEDKRERAVVLQMFANTLANNPDIQEGFIGRLGQGLARGVNNAGASTLQMVQAQGAEMMDELGIKRKNGMSDQGIEFLTRKRELMSIIQGQGMNIHSADDNFLQSSFIAAAPSAWMYPAAFTPAGQVAIMQSMGGESLQQSRLENPEMDSGLRTNVSTVSGIAQGAIESWTNVKAFQIMRGKLPRFTGLLNKAGIQNRWGRAALGYGAGHSTIAVGEYTEEVAQGATDKLLHSLAADLSGLDSDVDWNQYFKEWTIEPGEEAHETFLAVSAFAMIGGAGASFNHFKYGAALQRNKTILRAHGFTEGEVNEITNTADPDEASERFREAFKEAAKRGPTLSQAEKDRLATERKAAIELLKERNKAASKAGVPIITREESDFEGQAPRHIFQDPSTGEQSVHETEDDALLAWRDWARTQEAEQLDTMQEAAEADFLDNITGEGQAAENVEVKQTKAEQSLAKVKGEAEAEVKEAKKAQEKAKTDTSRRDTETRVQQAQRSLGDLQERLKVLLFDEGIAPADAGNAFENIFIRAKNYSRQVMGRIAGYTVEIYGGANIQDIAEDFAEVNMKQAVDGGFADPEIILDNIRRYEQASGAKLIDPDYQFDAENQLPIVEGFSKLARGVLMSELNSDMLPETVRKWVQVQLALNAASVELARDLSTAAEFRESLQAGFVPDRLHRELLDAVGLDPAAQQRRLEKKAEDQMAAEAMGGFPEVKEEAQGRIPHPDTLREQGHPLAGEVRRIWENLRKPTKRRNKEGRQVFRTNEANDFFLPVGQMEDLDDVRQALNEQGFDFETPADMLDALDASIAYNKPFYATGQAQDQSFAMQGVTPNADTQVFPGAEGSPTVIGPASFAVSAFHGTPHDVDKFTTDKIGTGEGLQAYGWGLYFADSKEVAEDYRQSLAQPEFSNRKTGERIDGSHPNIQTMRDRYYRMVQNGYKKDFEENFEVTGGNTYQVELNVEDDQLLDWDEVIDEQPAIEKLKQLPGWENIEERIWNYADQFSMNPTGETLLSDLYEDMSPQEASKFLASAGIKGIKFLDGMSRSKGKGSRNYVIFDGKDITITEENGQPVNKQPNDFPATQESFAVSLTAIHNLSHDNLRFADKMGGLAVPSVAVVRTGDPIEGFGGITLVGGRPLADPEENPVFDADAYTARFPKAEWKKVPVKVAQAMVDKIRPFAEKFDGYIKDAIWDNAVNRPDPQDTIHRMKNDSGARAAFLSLVHGIEVEPVMQPHYLAEQGSNPAFDSIRKRIQDGSFPRQPEYEGEHHKELTAATLAYLDNKNAKTLAKIKDDSKMRGNLKEIYDRDKAEMLNENGFLHFGNMDKVIQSMESVGQEIIDSTATREKLEEAIKGKEGEFHSWVDSEIMGMYDAPRIKVGRKFEPYTIENIAKVMASGKVAGEENAMTFSEGKLRAVNATRFQDLDHMKNQAEWQIRTEEEVEHARELVKQRMEEWRNKVTEFYKWESTWDALDASMEALAKFIKGSRTTTRMAAALRSVDIVGVPQELLDEAKEIADEFMETPVAYFESKPQRVVRLNEFHGAVVPKNTSQDILDILEKHGIQVEVSSSARTDLLEPRRKALQTLISQDKDNMSFSMSIDPRITEEFGEDVETDAYGLPVMPETLPEGHKLLRRTDRLRVVTLAEDHPLVAGGYLEAGKQKRTQFRTAIVDFLYDRGQDLAPGIQPVVYATGGGGGAGKSYILDVLEQRGAIDPQGAVKVNADDIKELIPEYQAIIDAGDGRAAGVTHEESSLISKALLKRLEDGPTGRKRNIVFDATLANGEKTLDQFDKWKKEGYQIHLIGVTIDPIEGMIRAAIRGQDKGRWVPNDELAKAHLGFSENLTDYIDRADAVNVFDNSEWMNTREILEKSADSKQIHIVNPTKWNTLKSDENRQPSENEVRRYLQGGNRGPDGRREGRGQAEIRQIPQGRRQGVQGSLSKGSESHALSMPGILRLEEAIQKKLTQGPDERVAYYQRLRDRLATTVLQLRESKRNVATTTTEAERERNRIQDALAEAHAVIKALPADARGRVTFNPAEVMDAKTEAGQLSAIMRLIDRADAALETVLKKQYQEAFETLLDLAKPDLRPNKSIRGRLTPNVQRMIAQVLEVVDLDSTTWEARLMAKQAEINALEASDPGKDPKAIAAANKQLVELYTEQTILEDFGAWSRMTSSELGHAYQQLQAIYINGRTIRRTLDENRREEIRAKRDEVLNSLPGVTQAKHAKRTADQGLKDTMKAWMLGFSSFHQVMERLFPNSTTARDFQDKVRAADRQFTRARIEARERMEDFIFGAWNLTGPGRRRQMNKHLATMSTRRDDWGIDIMEGVTFRTEKLTEEQANEILAGKLKPGWEKDMIAMTSLQQALSDFRMMRLKAQNEEKAFKKNVIQFQRLVKRGTPSDLVMSDMEALYILQLYYQEQYRPALDKYGFTEDVILALERKINDKALILGDFLRSEYDEEWNRLNPVYAKLYGLDMPKIRNYAPGAFESMDAKAAETPELDGFGQSSQVNSMSAGFTKARQHHMARPRQANAMQVYWSHLEATEYFIAYAELARDMRQVFGTPDVRRALEGNYGSNARELFSQWLQALEVDGQFRAETMRVLHEATNKALAGQSAIGLAYNVGVLLKQVPAAFGFILEMPHGAAIKAFAKVMAKPSTLRHVWSQEAVQQRVLTGMSPEDRRLLDAAKASPSFIMELLEIGRMPIAYADAAFTTISGSIAYQHSLSQAKKAGMDGKKAEDVALRHAARVIERTAQPATTQDRSMAEITSKGFTKFLFMFKSDPRQKLAIVGNALQDATEGRQGAKGKLARKALWGWFLYGFANELMADIWRSMSRDDDDEDRWNLKDYMAAAIAGPSSSVPFIGQGFESLVRLVFGTHIYSNSVNPIDKMPYALSKARKALEESPDFSDLEDWNLNDYLTTTQQLTSAMASVVSVIDPRFSIVPAGVRVVRDVQGMAVNAIDLVTPETEQERQLSIIESIKEETDPLREEETELRKKLAKELRGLTAEERVKRLDEIENVDTAKAVIRRLKYSDMSEVEKKLSRLRKEDRIDAIEKITEDMTESDKNAYIDELVAKGVL
jgi:predicted ABC-type ATPase